MNIKKTFIAGLFATAVVCYACGTNKTEDDTTTDASAIPMDRDTLGITTNKPIVDVVDSTTADKVTADSLTHSTANVTANTHTLVSSEGQTITAKYEGHDGMGVVTLSKAGAKDIKLMQKEKTAKGGVYTNGNITWTANGNEGTFEEGGKKTAYKVK